jgi:hypothetical protein
MRWDDSIEPPFAVPLCDWCGGLAEMEDVVDHGAAFYVIEADGTCDTQSCRCRFCVNDPIVEEWQSDGSYRRVR